MQGWSAWIQECYDASSPQECCHSETETAESANVMVLGPLYHHDMVVSWNTGTPKSYLRLTST